ncbi:type I secretion C-terminal target domain-containing protein [Enterobacter hormaechei]
MLYKLINASDATGGNGSDVVNGFTVGTWEGTADTDRIDLRDLLSDSGYTGTGSASYVNGVATLDSSAGNIADYIRVVQNGSNAGSGSPGRHRRSVLAHHAGDAERGADKSGDAAGEPPAVNCVKHCRGERLSRLFEFLYTNSHNPIFHKIILRARYRQCSISNHPGKVSFQCEIIALNRT